MVHGVFSSTQLWCEKKGPGRGREQCGEVPLSWESSVFERADCLQAARALAWALLEAATAGLGRGSGLWTLKALPSGIICKGILPFPFWTPASLCGCVRGGGVILFPISALQLLMLLATHRPAQTFAVWGLSFQEEHQGGGGVSWQVATRARGRLLLEAAPVATKGWEWKRKAGERDLRAVKSREAERPGLLSRQFLQRPGGGSG